MKKIISCVMIASLMLMSGFANVSAQARSYDVIFRSGAHGSFAQGETKQVIEVADGGVFPDEPNLNVEAGYAFMGWKQALPAVGSRVNGQMEFVAKYKVLTNGKEYRVRFIDTYENDVASDIVMQAELGDTINVRAKTVSGYTVDANEKSIVIGEKNNTITFVYRNGTEDPIVRNEIRETVVNDGPADNPNVDNPEVEDPNNQGDQPPKKEEVEVKDTPKGEGNEDIGEKDTPKGTLDKSSMIGIGVGIGGLLALLLGLVLLKRKKDSEDKANT